MPLSLDTRLRLLGPSPAPHAPELVAIVADWSARCDRIASLAMATIDPFAPPLPAVLSPIGAPNATPWRDFMLGEDCRDDG